MINADKPQNWKQDIEQSVDFFNKWFMEFAPATYREQRLQVTKVVEDALQKSADLSQITPDILRNHPAVLPTFRMCCCPPVARERLSGLAGVKKTLIEKMEEGSIPPRMLTDALDGALNKIVTVLAALLDVDLFPWLAANKSPDERERHRASTIVADRLCGSMSDPIIRNAQERRQLKVIGGFLTKLGYRQKAHPPLKPLTEMEPGTFAFRMNVTVGEVNKVKIPIDVGHSTQEAACIPAAYLDRSQIRRRFHQRQQAAEGRGEKDGPAAGAFWQQRRIRSVSLWLFQRRLSRLRGGRWDGLDLGTSHRGHEEARTMNYANSDRS